jgi:predicted DNA-binding protein (MmcQ/YjbR family)
MNKIHWVTVMIDGSISDNMLKQWIDESYNLIVAGFTRKEKVLFTEMTIRN